MSRLYYFILAASLSGMGHAQNVQINTAWNAVPIGEVRPTIWGVNDYEIMYGNTDRPGDVGFNEFIKNIQPGIIRIHNAALVWEWTQASTKTWDRAKIVAAFEKAYGFKNTPIMLNISHWPSFIHDGDILPENKHQEWIDLLVQLVDILDEEGIQIDYWEVLNENDNKYEQAGKLPELWGLLKKIMLALKAADPDAKVGGPALTWPKQLWVEGFLNECGGIIDFMSWHNYASGDPSTSNQNVINAIDNLENHAQLVLNELAERNITGVQTFLTEFNVQWTWTPYEERHHTHVGAVFQAGVMHRMAQLGVTGSMVWHAKGQSYGLILADNTVSSTGYLYTWGRRYLTGNMYTSSADDNQVETWAVSSGGNKSMLILNKSGNTKNVSGVDAILGLDNPLPIRVLQLNDSGYEPQVLALSGNQIELQPYSVTLITDKEAPKLGFIQGLQPHYVLDKAIALSWEEVDQSLGYNLYKNGELLGHTNDTFALFNQLQTQETYTLAVSPLDESRFPYDTASLQIQTRELALLIDDQTRGSLNHQVEYNDPWVKRSYLPAYNNYYIQSAAPQAKVTLRFDGGPIAFTGFYQQNGALAVVAMDNVPVDTIDFKGKNLKSFIWMYPEMEPGQHEFTLTLLSDGQQSAAIDNFYVFREGTELDNQAPSEPTGLESSATVKSVVLSWLASEDDYGVQGYLVYADQVLSDTIYHNGITLMGLEPDQVYQIQVRAFDPKGNLSDLSSPLPVALQEDILYPISRTEYPPVIDGLFDTVWSKTALYHIVQASGTPPASAADLSGEFRALWDNDYIYFFLQVKDDIINPKTGTLSYEFDDSFEFFFDINNDKSTSYGADDYWFSFAAEDGSYIHPYGNNKFPFATVDHNNQGYTAEMRVKWSGMKWYTAATGEVIGIDVHINDNDTGFERKTKLHWAPNSADAKLYPLYFQTVVLVDTPTFVLPTITSSPDFNSSLRCFPSPAQDRLRVMASSTIQHLDLISQTGVSLSQYQPETPQVEISIDHIPSGSYLIKVITRNGTEVLRFMKQ
ncbi:MAG: T9SS type A sorting domain-containing protein [Cytophagales bacterium]|nr:T9SS type A sorting domain-containing protein [Cytophagales bacterium]